MFALPKVYNQNWAFVYRFEKSNDVTGRGKTTRFCCNHFGVTTWHLN